MHLMYFTEQPMSAYNEQAGRDFGATALMFSNKHFDPVAGSRLYNEYLEHYRLAESVGFDGIMLNEHHNAPFCMQAKCNVFASILAATTKRVKIVLLGNPLPLADNPVRLAEELAMIDMVSCGRLVSGFVRGGGQEQLATGVNPAYNRERFEEAHDLIVKTWTQPGPFRWEGTHYQHRVVNPWAVPLQKPHPRVWIPGVLSKETIIWAAQQRYPYIALSPRSRRPRRSGSSTTRWRPSAATPAVPSTAATCSAATSPRPTRRRWPTRASSCGCRASSPAWRIRCGRARRATSRRRTARPSSSTRWAAARIPRGAAFEDQLAERSDPGRHAEDGHPAHPQAARGDASVDHGLLGRRRLREPRGHARPASSCSARKCCRPCARSARSSASGARSRPTRRRAASSPIRPCPPGFDMGARRQPPRSRPGKAVALRECAIIQPLHGPS